MKKLWSIVFFFLITACAAVNAPPDSQPLWPLARKTVFFTGMLNTGRGELPVQGAMQCSDKDIRFALIAQNGFFLGSGFLNGKSGSIQVHEAVPQAEQAVVHSGKALSLFLQAASTPAAPGGSVWKQVDSDYIFEDSVVKLVIDAQESSWLK